MTAIDVCPRRSLSSNGWVPSRRGECRVGVAQIVEADAQQSTAGDKPVESVAERGRVDRLTVASLEHEGVTRDR